MLPDSTDPVKLNYASTEANRVRERPALACIVAVIGGILVATGSLACNDWQLLMLCGAIGLIVATIAAKFTARPILMGVLATLIDIAAMAIAMQTLAKIGVFSTYVSAIASSVMMWPMLLGGFFGTLWIWEGRRTR